MAGIRQKSLLDIGLCLYQLLVHRALANGFTNMSAITEGPHAHAATAMRTGRPWVVRACTNASNACALVLRGT